MERLNGVRGGPDELGKKEHHGIKRKYDQPLHDLRQGSGGLRRPKRPLSFQISGVQKDHSQLASTDSSVSTAVDALEKRIHLIDLIIRRNKNQHRNQSFFKHLCLLRKSLARLLDVSSQLFELSRSTTVSSVKRSSEQVRRNFEVEANLRSQKDVLEEHVREVLVPKCWTSFSGLVGDSQFGNLGVVLVALLSEIACGRDGVGAMRVVRSDDEETGFGRARWGRGEEKDTSSDYVGSLLGMSTRMTGEDQGEIVERVYDRGVLGEEDDMVAEAEGDISQGQDGKNTALREETPQEEKRVIESRGQSMSMEREEPAQVKQTSKKVSKESNIETNTMRKTKKGKKSKNPIDDLFSGLL